MKSGSNLLLLCNQSRASRLSTPRRLGRQRPQHANGTDAGTCSVTLDNKTNRWWRGRDLEPQRLSWGDGDPPEATRSRRFALQDSARHRSTNGFVSDGKDSSTAQSSSSHHFNSRSKELSWTSAPSARKKKLWRRRGKITPTSTQTIISAVITGRTLHQIHEWKWTASKHSAKYQQMCRGGISRWVNVLFYDRASQPSGLMEEPPGFFGNSPFGGTDDLLLVALPSEGTFAPKPQTLPGDTEVLRAAPLPALAGSDLKQRSRCPTLKTSSGQLSALPVP